MLWDPVGMDPTTSWSPSGLTLTWLSHQGRCLSTSKNSAEGSIAPAGAKVTGATIRMQLLNKFISFLAVLNWKTGLRKCRQSAQWGTYIPGQFIPSNGCMSSSISCTDFSYYTAQWRKMCKSHWSLRSRSRYLPSQYLEEKHYARYGGCKPYSRGDTERQCKMCQSHWSLKYRSKSPGQGACRVST